MMSDKAKLGNKRGKSTKERPWQRLEINTIIPAIEQEGIGGRAGKCRSKYW